MKRRRTRWYKTHIIADLLGIAFASFLVIIPTISCTLNRGLIPFGSSDSYAALLNSSTALVTMNISDPQELANEANAAIYSSFARNQNGSVVYPSDFGGAYFENGKLIVCIIDEQNMDHYQSLMNPSQKSIAIFRVVKHSFNDLMQLAKEMAAKEDAFITYGVDVMNNRAEVFLPNENQVKSNNLSNINSNIPVIYKYMQKLY